MKAKTYRCKVCGKNHIVKVETTGEDMMYYYKLCFKCYAKKVKKDQQKNGGK